MSPAILSSFVVGYFLVLLSVAFYTSKGSDNQSFFIGDKQRDIDCGMAIGISGFLIAPNENWVSIAIQICS